MASISSLLHPEYVANVSDWKRFHDVLESGRRYVETYLTKYSERENNDQFLERVASAYVPAHAKAAVLDVTNSIAQRMCDVKRTIPDDDYKLAIQGLNGGIDREGSTIEAFLRTKVLPDLAGVGKIAVYVDKAKIPESADALEVAAIRPYCYVYQAEDIHTWRHVNGELMVVVLRDCIETMDAATGAVIGNKDQYRVLKLVTGLDGEKSVSVQILEKGAEMDTSGGTPDVVISSESLKLSRIPLVIGELPEALLEDVEAAQAALLNLASSDYTYALKSNFPLYTEQIDRLGQDVPGLESLGPNGEQPDETGGILTTNVANARTATVKPKVIPIGATNGRGYASGLDRPGFINPSSEPLRASIELRQTIKEEIRQIMNLSLKSLYAQRASADSKKFDESGMEAGLGVIGYELQRMEIAIAEIWMMYQEVEGQVIIKYPEDYSLKTDDSRRLEAKELAELTMTVPSVSFQKELVKEVVSVLRRGKSTPDQLKKMFDEIDAQPVIVTDPKVLIADMEAGLVGPELASKVRLYPEGEAKRGQDAVVERLARIMAAQGGANGTRGVSSPGDTTAADEKTLSQTPAATGATSAKTRGEAK